MTTPEQPRTAAAYDSITDAWSLAVSCDDFVYRLHNRGYEISPIAQARPAVASELRAALELLDPIIRHVESWPPAGDSFLDDLRTIRAALASDAGSVGALDGYDAGKGAALIDGWWAERHLAIAGRPEGDPVAVQAFMEMQERAARILDAGIINADAGSLDAERQGEQ